MSWFYVDDGFPDCEKLAAIPEKLLTSAVGLWTLAGAWSRKKLTGGYIPGGQVRRLGGTVAEAQALVNCGLWELADNGYRFHDWAEWQETAEEVENKREREKARKQAWRLRKHGGISKCPAGTSRGQRRDIAGTDEGQTVLSRACPPPCPDSVLGDPSPSPSPSLASLEGRSAPANDQSAVRPHPSRLISVLLEELRAEAFERNLRPTPSAPPSQQQAAAARVDDLVRSGMFPGPQEAARALVRAALDLVRDHKRPFGLALLDATVEPPKPEWKDNVLPWGRA